MYGSGLRARSTACVHRLVALRREKPVDRRVEDVVHGQCQLPHAQVRSQVAAGLRKAADQQLANLLRQFGGVRRQNLLDLGRRLNGTEMFALVGTTYWTPRVKNTGEKLGPRVAAPLSISIGDDCFPFPANSGFSCLRLANRTGRAAAETSHEFASVAAWNGRLAERKIHEIHRPVSLAWATQADSCRLRSSGWSEGRFFLTRNRSDIVAQQVPGGPS